METPSVQRVNVSVGRVAIWTATALGVAGLLLALFFVRDLLLVFFVGIVASASLRPLVLNLERHRVPKPVAVILIYLAFLGLIVGGALLLLPSLVTQAATWAAQLPTRYQDLVTALQSSSNGLLATIGSNLPAPQNLTGMVGGVDAGPILVTVANAMVSLLTATITVLAVALFWTMDQARMERLWLSLAPPAQRPRLLAVWRDMEAKMGAYVRGTAIVATVIAVITGVGYFAMGLPFVLVLVVLTALGEVIPGFGFVIGLVPAVAIAMAISPQMVLLVLAWNAVIRVFQHGFFMPRVMGEAVGVSPLVIIFALFAFDRLLGLVGAFLAIPLAAVIQVMLDHFVLNAEPAPETPIDESVPLAAARLQLQRLRERLRERLRSRTDYLSVEEGLDAVDQRIESIIDWVDQAIAQAGSNANGVDPKVMGRIEQALAEVDQLMAESRDESNPVGVTAALVQAEPQVAEDVAHTLEEAKQVLTTAAAEVRDMAADNAAAQDTETYPTAARSAPNTSASSSNR